MKFLSIEKNTPSYLVAPVRERGLKCQSPYWREHKQRRSREGAWIEIIYQTLIEKAISVAPVRERGLKLYVYRHNSFKAAVAPVRERGLKYMLPYIGWIALCRSREGAWIEMLLKSDVLKVHTVAPVRERGLKWEFENKIDND